MKMAFKNIGGKTPKTKLSNQVPPGSGRDPPHMQSTLSPQGYGLYNCSGTAGGGGRGDAPALSRLSPRNKQTFNLNEYKTFSPPQKYQDIIPASLSESEIGRRSGSLHANKMENNWTEASTPTTIRSGRIIVGDYERDRTAEKNRLIDSLSQSEIITCLPGFKRRPRHFRRRESQINDPIHRITPQRTGLNNLMPMVPYSNAANSSTINESSFKNNSCPAASYPTRQEQSMPLSSIPSYIPDNSKGKVYEMDNIERFERNFGVHQSPSLNSPLFNGNAVDNSTPIIPPASPITRAKEAISQAQSQVSKINNLMEENQDKLKPPGAWKNVATPLYAQPASSSQKQKMHYRMELERQIHASKMKKAEQQRRDRDASHHPLGPEYSHPALTYYSATPTQKYCPPTGPVTSSALTNYMKEKYDLQGPSLPTPTQLGTVNSIPRYPNPFPPGAAYNSETVAGQMGPLQQAKVESLIARNSARAQSHTHGEQRQETGPSAPMVFPSTFQSAEPQAAYGPISFEGPSGSNQNQEQSLAFPQQHAHGFGIGGYPTHGTIPTLPMQNQNTSQLQSYDYATTLNNS